MRLVLAEKPSVAADLARVMDPGATRREGYLEGRQCTWTWALGHLAELAPPEAYQPALKGRWEIGWLPVIPDRFDLQPREGRAQQLGVIRRLLRAASEVMVATDAGREGELIWAYIREVCGYEGPVRRLWLSESTPAAVKAAFAALRPPMQALEAAARARAQADWAVGMNCTMALSAKHGGLWSAGRVQTPTLALLVERERAIRDFVPQDYCVVTATFEAQGGGQYVGRWFRGDADRLPVAPEAEALAAKVRGQTGTVTAVERRRATEQPPRLFNLTDLQRAANSKFGMTAAATLKAAQALYEEHKLLTYPRTDSRHVSRETAGTFPNRLRAVGGLPAPLGPIAHRLAGDCPDPGRRVVDDAKVSDHHAVLPTDHAPDLARLSEGERRVYDLVARRFVAVLLAPAQYDDTAAITEVRGETFRSRAHVLAVAGWREVEPPAATPEAKGKGTDRSRAGGDGEEDDPSERDDESGDLGRLREGMASRCVHARAEARKTQPPRRYSEATLLRAMETAGRLLDDEELAEVMRERGLGTPATRAGIIEVLVHREYVRREKRVLVPTERGEVLVGLAPAELRDVATTGDWEARLRQIESGAASAADFLHGIADLTRRMVQDVAGQERAAPAAGVRATVGTCPTCGAPVVEGRKGFGCSRWRDADGGCKWVLGKEVAHKTLTAAQARELLANGETSREVRGFRSKAGKEFAARLRMDRGSGRVTFVFDTPRSAVAATTAKTATPATRRRGASGAGQTAPTPRAPAQP